MTEISVITKSDNRYPSALADIQQPPKVLFCKGNINLLDKMCIAVVGSRLCSNYGLTVAEKLGEKLSKSGATVVSGLAKGIDSAAARGALKGGGNTIAVLGTDLEKCYPAENQNLMDEIGRKGLLITEYEKGAPVRRYNFPRRNRIISGISMAVVVVEARYNSGALITAENALDNGRDVYAVPGEITNECCAGSNRLLQDGAEAIYNVEDFIKGLGLTPKISDENKRRLGEDELMIVECINRHGELTTEELSSLTMLSPQRINSLVSLMEIKGIVKTGMGRVFISALDV